MESIETIKSKGFRCDCNLCKLSRKIERTMKSGSHQQKNKLIRSLSEALWNTGEERDMIEAAYNEIRKEAKQA